jgi:hypothetical protein
MKHTKTQTDRILAILERGRGITPIQALNNLGCFRLSARIMELKKRGHAIRMELKEQPNGKRVARYSMERGPA